MYVYIKTSKEWDSTKKHYNSYHFSAMDETKKTVTHQQKTYTLLGEFSKKIKPSTRLAIGIKVFFITFFSIGFALFSKKILCDWETVYRGKKIRTICADEKIAQNLNLIFDEKISKRNTPGTKAAEVKQESLSKTAVVNPAEENADLNQNTSKALTNEHENPLATLKEPVKQKSRAHQGSTHDNRVYIAETFKLYGYTKSPEGLVVEADARDKIKTVKEFEDEEFLKNKTTN